MASKVQYRVINTTIKPEKIVNGRDTRKAIERVGYSVQFYDSAGQTIILPPGQSRITQELTDGLINFNDLGLVKLEKIENVANLLQDHATPKPRRKASSKKKNGEVTSAKDSRGNS